MGASQWWTLRKHIWSKVLPNVAVTAGARHRRRLLVVASLSFLGIGVQPPAPTWGGMLSADLGYLAQQTWAPIFPALLMMATVGSLNLLADAHPRRRHRSAAARPARTCAEGDRRCRSLSSPRTPPARRTLDVERPAGQRRRPPGRRARRRPSRSRRGEAVGLVGESGSGKTLTCRAVLGLLPATGQVDDGTIVLGEGRRRASTSPAPPAAPGTAVRGTRHRRRLPGPRRPTSTPSITVGHQLAEQLRVKRRARRGARPANGPSSCSPRSACTTPRASTTSTRTSSPAACCSAC